MNENKIIYKNAIVVACGLFLLAFVINDYSLVYLIASLLLYVLLTWCERTSLLALFQNRKLQVLKSEYLPSIWFFSF